ncbi:MAG: hypothetical protein LBS53_00420 [Synergistaceae bacterium]|jgi:hypothetical protein|nr:hypothetical protein [Synergistaceae bacterium]
MYELNKIFLAFLTVLLVVAAASASTLQVTNQKTDSHVAVPGTNVYFVPARELSLASAFGGFESKGRRIEVIAANIDAPFEDIAAGFTDASFQSKGMELKSRGDLTINGRKAILFKVLHPDAGINWGKWIMLAENAGSTLVVNAVFISGDADAAYELEIMLKGLYLDDAVQAKPANVPAPAAEVSEPAVSADSGDVLPNGVPMAPSRMIISNELEPIPRSMPVSDSPLSGDFDGDAVRPSVTETAAISGDTASGDENAAPPPESSRDRFDRDAAIRMLSGVNAASEDMRGEDSGESASSEDVSPENISSGDMGSADITM